MTEAEWLACEDPHRFFGEPVRFESDRKWRLFACACCRRVEELMPDERSHFALDAAEEFADGLVTEEELGRAFEDAQEAALQWYFGAPGVPHSCGLASALAVDVTTNGDPSTGIPEQAAVAVAEDEQEKATPRDAEQVVKWALAVE